jgi:hypothetical protein
MALQKGYFTGYGRVAGAQSCHATRLSLAGTLVSLPSVFFGNRR